MLNNKNAANLMKELDFLEENDIPINTQVVLCPDYNDGKELERTLNDLWKYKSILNSIAIVPVGITKFRQEKIKQVDKEKAIETIEIVEKFNKKIKKNIASVSDEFFLMAEQELPEKKYYNGYNQLEDGVGSLRCLIDDFKKRIKKVPKAVKSKKEFTIACSVSAKDAFIMFTSICLITLSPLNLNSISTGYFPPSIVPSSFTSTHKLCQSELVTTKLSF